MDIIGISPFVNIVDVAEGKILLVTNNIMSILKYIVKSIKNEKFLVNRPDEILDTLVNNIGYDKVTMIIDSKFTALKFGEDVTNRGTSNVIPHLYTKNVSGKIFDVHSSKKFIKFNSAIFYETGKKPFNVYMEDGYYHLVRNDNECRKVQFKIYP